MSCMATGAKNPTLSIQIVGRATTLDQEEALHYAWYFVLYHVIDCILKGLCPNTKSLAAQCYQGIGAYSVLLGHQPCYSQSLGGFTWKKIFLWDFVCYSTV